MSKYVMINKKRKIMEVYEKLTKQIVETKYLSAENSYRYRPIMRLFYKKYEQLEYWLYKEDVYRELKENELFNTYTIEECERDLETLTEWLSLRKMQDTKQANSIEEFKNKKFRYQLTEYATQIERLTISLEEMEIKTASLEPKLFDRLRISIAKLEDGSSFIEEDAFELWEGINDDFTKLNQNYQDFLKKFNEPKSEELLQSVLFLQFKGEITKYLREFIRGYQKNIHSIRASISKIDAIAIEEFLEKINAYYKKTPILNQEFDFQKLKENNLGKMNNIFKWFVGTGTTPSEGDKLMSTTDSIIVKITKYASSLIELRGNMTNRKEEYKHLCRVFDKLETIEDCHKYASVIFGIESVRHFTGNSNLNTDVIVNTYDIPSIEICLSSRTKLRKEKVKVEPIVDKTAMKKQLLEEYRKRNEKNKEILKNLVKDGKISLTGSISLSKVERRYVESLLANQSKKETTFGLAYHIIKKEGMCEIIAEDGIFYMESMEIEFEGEIDGYTY